MSLPLSAVDAELSALCTTEVQRVITGLRIEPLSLPLAQIDKLLEALGTPGALAASALSRQGRAAPANDTTATKTPRPPARGPRTKTASVRPGMPRVPSFDPPAMPVSPPPASSHVAPRPTATQAPLPPTRRDLPPVRIAMAPPAPPPAPSRAVDPAPEPALPPPEVAAAQPELPVATAVDPDGVAPELKRDPDAEFDALLADARPPSVFPQRHTLEAQGASAEPSARDAHAADEDVLAALAGDGPATEKPVAAATAPSVYPEEPTTEVDDAIEIDVGVPFEGEPTDVLEHQALGMNAASNDANGVEEIDLADLELAMDEDEPPHPPPLPDPRATPAEQAPHEKRPSFLGRLFGPRKSEPQD
jgi:hypothetical protein